MKKKYVQKLSSFPSYYWNLAEVVQRRGRFGIELLSKSELMGERARFYRWVVSMQEHEPNNPMTAFIQEIEIHYTLGAPQNGNKMVIEFVHRPTQESNIKLALDKEAQGEYTDPVVNETARATADIFAQLEELGRKEAEREGKQGTSNE